MKFNFRSKWLWLGVGAYLLFIVITLPASVLTSRLAKHGIQSVTTQGTVWHGNVSGLQAGVLNLGSLAWNIRWLPLFTGKLAADIKLTQPSGYAQAVASVGITGKLIFRELSASLPLQSLLGSGGLPGGWQGIAQFKFAELVFKNGWPISAQGSLDVSDLTGPASAPNNIGAYRLQFTTESATPTALIGNLKDLPGAAIDVVGTLKLANDRSYVLETQVAARANAPQDIAQGMQYLGAADAQSRRPFSVSGTF